MTPTTDENGSNAMPHRFLTLFDCICIIIGTIIGAGIFKMPAVVARHVPDVGSLALVWICGGVIALIGAICFAELTTTYPDRGCDYGYLKRAYHRRVGFAFAWAAFWVIRPGNIGAMAMIFGQFAVQLLPNTISPFAFSILGLIVTTMANLLGVRFGKMTQNVLSVAKVAGILLVVIAAFAFWPHQNSLQQESSSGEATQVQAGSDSSSAAIANSPSENDANGQPSTEDGATVGWFWLALMFVMFTFGGWNDIAFVASEVREPKKNLLPALMIGTLIVLFIYLLVNFALVYGLGFDRMQTLGKQWQSASSALISDHMGELGHRLFAALICVSCLGAINAMVFTSPRIYWACSADYPALRWIAGGSLGRGWWRAMLLQAVVTWVFIVGFGTRANGFDNIVAATAPYFWMFLALTVISLVVCRIRFKGKFDGFRVPLGPVLPVTFVAACVFMTYRAFVFMIEEELGLPTILIGIWVVLGIGLSFVLKSRIDP